jgi:hypothetical protein
MTSRITVAVLGRSPYRNSRPYEVEKVAATSVPATEKINKTLKAGNIGMFWLSYCPMLLPHRSFPACYNALDKGKSRWQARLAALYVAPAL